MADKKIRIWEIDFFRGVAAVLMAFDHLAYDLGVIFQDAWARADKNHFLTALAGLAKSYRGTLFADYFRVIFIAGVFLFISGICANFSRNNYARGLRLLAIAFLLSLVSWGFALFARNDAFIIYFGILHCLAVAMLISEPLKKLPDVAVFILAVLIIIAGLAFESVRTESIIIFIPFNIRPIVFNTADYYPLLPHLAFYFFGYLFGKRLYAQKKSLFSRERNIPPFNFFGRNALPFYFIHQAVLLAVLLLTGVIFFGF